MNRNGALAGILVGGITIVVWKQISGGIFDVYEIVPGFILSTIAIVVVSLMSGAPEKKVLDSFESYEGKLNTLD